MDKIKFAIIGAGKIAIEFVEGMLQSGETELVGIWEEDRQIRTEFTDRYPVEIEFESLDELAECKEVQAVYIASPTYCHAKQAVTLMRNRKHVLCSVPIASNTLELERMVMIASENRVVLLEAIANVFMPGYQVLKESMEKIGKVRHIVLYNCRYEDDYDAYRNGVQTDSFKAECSSGAIMDNGVYAIHMLISLLGMPIGVKTQGIILPGSIDGAGVMIGKCRDTLVEIHYSKIADSYLPCEIQGEEGTILFQSIEIPDMIRVILRDGTDDTYQIEDRKEASYYVIQAFLDMIRGEKNMSEYNEETITAMKVMDDIRKELNIVFPADY